MLKHRCAIFFLAGTWIVSGGVMADEFDYQHYAAALTAHVDDQGWVDYAALKNDRADLDAYVEALANLSSETYETWSEEAKIAFWTNAYNGITLQVIIDHYPIKPGGIISRVRFPNNSIRQIDGVWTKITRPVMGRELTLDGIEHDILRVDFNEPRIHMALVCAARSCPPLRNEPFTAERLNEQLDDQTRRFLARANNFRIDSAMNTVYLSAIFSWFGGDFIKSHAPSEGFGRRKDAEAASLGFISQYLTEENAGFLREGNYRVRYTDYDWTLNERD